LKTEINKIDKQNIDIKVIEKAADIIVVGGLVAFPTETVYGLGANALDENAVKSIFEAKGRPSDNPLIVHVADIEDVECLVREIPTKALLLMKKFWPGPLTIIMQKSKLIPDIITAGLDTVAVRMPSHPIAIELIRAAKKPVAAPSANISGRPSPTQAKHVIEDLFGKVDMIIDGGDSKIGLESTVIDVTCDPPLILRPGGITHDQLIEVLEDVKFDPGLSKSMDSKTKPRAPGMKYTHYSPKADMSIVDGQLEDIVKKINQLVETYMEKGLKVGVLATEQTKFGYKDGIVLSLGDRSKPETIASNLFKSLRELDEKNADIIFAESIEAVGVGLAIMNRMKKAAGYNIISA